MYHLTTGHMMKISTHSLPTTFGTASTLMIIFIAITLTYDTLSSTPFSSERSPPTSHGNGTNRGRITMPFTLKHLSVLVTEDTFELLSCISGSPTCCSRTLLTGLKTLRFGDGAAELLPSALYGRAYVSVAVIPTNSATTTATTTPADKWQHHHRGQNTVWFPLWKPSTDNSQSKRIQHLDPMGLDQLTHYACARPDASLLGMNVLADLSVPRWKQADIEPLEDVMESLMILHCRN